MAQSKQDLVTQTSDANFRMGTDAHKTEKWVASVYRDGSHGKTYSIEPSADLLASQLGALGQGQGRLVLIASPQRWHRLAV